MTWDRNFYSERTFVFFTRVTYDQNVPATRYGEREVSVIKTNVVEDARVVALRGGHPDISSSLCLHGTFEQSLLELWITRRSQTVQISRLVVDHAWSCEFANQALL